MDKKWKIRIIFIIITSLLVGGLFAAYVLPRLTESIAGWGNNEMLTAITFLALWVTLGVPFIEFKLHSRQAKKFREEDREREESDKLLAEQTANQERERLEGNERAVYEIDITVDTSLPHNMVRFSATIKNVGHKRIATRFSNLYIDEGVLSDESADSAKYVFPFILKHETDVNGRPDCILCTKLREKNNYNSENMHYPKDALNSPSGQFKNIFHTNVSLDHLSDKSIKYIDPQEKFSEDVIIQFKKSGVYRVTFIVLPHEHENYLEYGAHAADCQCATKQFYIPTSLSMEEQQGGEGQ